MKCTRTCKSVTEQRNYSPTSQFPAWGSQVPTWQQLSSVLNSAAVILATIKSGTMLLQQLWLIKSSDTRSFNHTKGRFATRSITPQDNLRQLQAKFLPAESTCLRARTQLQWRDLWFPYLPPVSFQHQCIASKSKGALKRKLEGQRGINVKTNK